MDRTAVFVDAGYLFASGAWLLTGERRPRSELTLNCERLLELLAGLATELTGLPLLRIYWYDGAASGPSAQHLALSHRPNVKLRLGLLDPEGRQKGVDALLLTDLLSLARNHAMADALLLSGDGDLRLGVQQAQEFGVRVHLLGIAPSHRNQSSYLVQEADTRHELERDAVESFLSHVPDSTGARGGGASSSDPGADFRPALLVVIAKKLAAQLDSSELNLVLQESFGGTIPATIDRQLLLAATHSFGDCPLSPEDKRQLRVAFLDSCRHILD